MYPKTIFVLSLGATVSCYENHPWHPPTALDRRGPCPMLNSVANHGFIARDGLNISVDQLVDGLEAALNLAPDAVLPVAQLAVTTSTTGYNNTLNLDDLLKHGVIEHDASLSRNDIFFGDNQHFNPAIFETVAAHFNEETISIEAAAIARSDRIKAARVVNPEFTFGDKENRFSLLETATYMRIFGQGIEGHARTDWVNILFREQRLPYEEGFQRSENSVTNDEVLAVAQKIAGATPA